MKILASLYGLQRTVRSNCSKAVTAIAKGATIAEALKAPDLVDTADHPGLIVLDGPSSLLSGEEHFHCFFLLAMIREAITMGRIPKDQEEMVFHELLAERWGLLLLLSHSGYSWIAPPQNVMFRSCTLCALIFSSLIRKASATQVGRELPQPSGARPIHFITSWQWKEFRVTSSGRHRVSMGSSH